MRIQIKKATGKVASLIKRIQNLNFKSEQEIIETYHLCSQMDYYESRRLQGKFEYYWHLFELKETLPWGELTEQESKQYEAIWKLVEFEEGLHE
jgi:hypothetical protein